MGGARHLDRRPRRAERAAQLHGKAPDTGVHLLVGRRRAVSGDGRAGHDGPVTEEYVPAHGPDGAAEARQVRCPDRDRS